MATTTNSQQKLQAIINTVTNNDLFDGSFKSYDHINPITGEAFGSVERAEIWTADEYRSNYMIVELVDGKIVQTDHWLVASEGAVGSTIPANRISLKGVADKLAEIIQTDEDHKMFGTGRYAV
jgi:hypothetical protein